ncbi:unnamed protein product [Peronospora effusa]|uniref:Uncharacterized protein n=1 Tax=Peronospora effusa TaxID=542832 RepID=A0A3R7WJ36_9STRA|nr:hypothetical protein DD237_003665 [Peronospora effusa]CAI5705408.1 unnamed protein product [Peronospora effusa]
MDTETKTWLKSELVSALGFAEVDEIVAYITSTFNSKQEACSYLIELLGIPVTRAEHISTRLFLPETSLANPNAQGTVTIATKGQERLVRQPTAEHASLQSSKKNKKKAVTTLLNNALVINCLRCGRIEYNGERRCVFCDTELRYEADAVTADHAAQQHMEELVRLDETGTERTRVLDAEQYLYDEEQVDKQDTSSRRPITMALDLDNKQFIDVKIARNEQLPKNARELVDGVQRKMSKGKRGKGSIHQTTEAASLSVSSDGIREAVVVVDDSVTTPRAQATAVDNPSQRFHMSTTVSAKGLSPLQRHVTASVNSGDMAPANPLWDFYASGLVDENDDGSGGEDTEDELETQDWILFQRQRAQARLANACQREARVVHATKD